MTARAASGGDPDRLPWLQPYRAPARRISNRRSGITALVGVAGLGAVLLLLNRGLPSLEPDGRMPSERIVLAPPQDIQPPIVVQPLRVISQSGGGRSDANRIDPPRRLAARPAVPRELPPPQPVEAQLPEQPAVAQAPVEMAAAPPPDPPRPAVNPAARVVRGRTVQMGVYLSRDQAEAAWKSAIGDYTFLVTMPKSIEPVTLRSKRFYRLQLGTPSRAHARQLCNNLRTIGRSCTVA